MRALFAYVSTCLACWRADVPTCLACLRAHLPTCLACLGVHVPTCLACFAWSRANVTCVPTWSSAITTNNKNKFSITCFPYIFVIVLCLFLLKKNCCTFLHFSYQVETFNGCYDKLCTKKWFDFFCFSITLRVIFKWLIKGERWIIMCGS